MNKCLVLFGFYKRAECSFYFRGLSTRLIKNFSVFLRVENVMEEEAQVMPKKDESSETQETSIIEQQETRTWWDHKS